MRNILAYPISKTEIETVLQQVIKQEQDIKSVGSTTALCLQLALQIVRESEFKLYPTVPIELA